MTENKKRFTLRIEQKIFERVQESARKNKRAIGSEMEFILETMLDLMDSKGKRKKEWKFQT